MTGRKEKAPGRLAPARGITPTQREPSWHTQGTEQKHLSRGASRTRRLIMRAADTGRTLSLAEIAQTMGTSTRTAFLWLRELDGPGPAGADTPPPPTPGRTIGGPRDAP